MATIDSHLANFAGVISQQQPAPRPQGMVVFTAAVEAEFAGAQVNGRANIPNNIAGCRCHPNHHGVGRTSAWSNKTEHNLLAVDGQMRQTQQILNAAPAVAVAAPAPDLSSGFKGDVAIAIETLNTLRATGFELDFDPQPPYHPGFGHRVFQHLVQDGVFEDDENLKIQVKASIPRLHRVWVAINHCEQKLLRRASRCQRGCEMLLLHTYLAPCPACLAVAFSVAAQPDFLQLHLTFSNPVGAVGRDAYQFLAAPAVHAALIMHIAASAPPAAHINAAGKLHVYRV